MKRLGIILALLLFVDGRAMAQAVRIHAVFQNYYYQLRPQNGGGVVTDEYMVELSPDKTVHEMFKSSSASHNNSRKFAQTLGGESWHVASPHQLVKTVDHGQNTVFVTIDVDGQKCRAKWESRLAPGFSEHKFVNLELGGVPAYFSRAYMVSSTCTIASV